MLVCHCNVITARDIEAVVREFLEADPWQLIVPAKVYHEMGKRGRCCGCFPNVIDIIIRTTEAFHGEKQTASVELIDMRTRLEGLREKLRGVSGERRSTGHRAA